jgi:hypothetical protein
MGSGTILLRSLECDFECSASDVRVTWVVRDSPGIVGNHSKNGSNGKSRILYQDTSTSIKISAFV